MVAVKRLLAPIVIPSSSNELSVMTYNVLLPNSSDNWWNYKMYLPPIESRGNDDDVSAWPHRSNLLRERIGLVDADVVCIQEVSPESFDDDFAFMKEDLGYDGVELFKKGRFRPATFWKKSRCDLVSPPVHKDRTLLTAFKLQKPTTPNNAENDNKTWYVLNCHLQAGAQAPRRLRQINEGVTAVVKLGRKLKEENPTDPRLVVCGDFNGGSECAAVRYLEDGSVSNEFVEDGGTVTSKEKKIPLDNVMVDVASLPELGRPAPPTLVVPELISLMVDKDTSPFESPAFSAELVARLTCAYNRLASSISEDGTKTMTVTDVEKWLISINGLVGRGSEFRKAAKEMGWKEPVEDENKNGEESTSPQLVKKPRIVLPENSVLTLQGFLNVYEDELRQGKFWGIAHDLSVMNEPLPYAGVFQGRFDRMYCSSAISPTTVLDTISDVACPNAAEPSDHLPVVASFRPS